MDAPQALPTNQLGHRAWRLNNLYKVIDKDGRAVPFRLNWAQEALLSELHFQNIILKARQLGFTTFIQLYMLDACLFNSNIRAGTIAHKLDDAKTIFRDKVKYPYENLPEQLRAAVPIAKDSADELLFANNSSIRVGTSMRSGTLQYLHISEYGKLCAQFPEKAREVRTGALNTVQAGQVVFLESTAEGQEGHFFDLSEAAQAKQRLGSPLTPLDFKFHFYPWHGCPDYSLDPAGVVIPQPMQRYFDTLKDSHGIKLSDAQKAWYVKKSETQLGDMKREYPSTPAEAFEASVEGAYYADQMAAAELQGRIGTFPHDPNYPVHTAWDIGRGDYTAIWFFQRQIKRVRLVHYFQNCGEELPYYATELKKLYEKNGWQRSGAVDWMPHDIRVREWGTGHSRIESALQNGLNPRIAPELSLEDGIQAVRSILPHCEWDAGPCAQGTAYLKTYRKEWDEQRGIWKDKPRHDSAADCADSFRYLACAYRELLPPPEPKKPKGPRTDENGVWAMTVNDLLEIHGRPEIRVRV